MDDFSIFSKLAKTLATKINDEEDRFNAELWIKKLQDEVDRDLAINYLKLLIFEMQKKKLDGIFSAPPANDLILNKNLPELIFLTSECLKKNTEELKTPERFQSVQENSDEKNDKVSPILTSIGADSKEYAAVQVVNDQFSQAYYAISMGKPIIENNLNISDEDLSFDDETEDENSIEEFIKQTAKNESANPNEKSCGCSESLTKMTSKIPDNLEHTRPTWGRNRYIRRLIDQSPFSVGDLENFETNAMLSAVRET